MLEIETNQREAVCGLAGNVGASIVLSLSAKRTHVEQIGAVIPTMMGSHPGFLN